MKKLNQLFKIVLKKVLFQVFSILTCLIIPLSAWGVSSLGCIGATVAEYLLPGLGYGLLGHYDKLLVFGGARWVTLNKYLQYSTEDDYEENFSNIYIKRELEDDKIQHDFFYSRETFYANAYSSMYGNLTFATFYDLYETGCDENTETFGLMLAPFQIWNYYDRWTFWVPTIWASSVSLESDVVIYHVDKDLSRNEMINTSFLKYQLVGIGEEMLFRGIIQQSLYNLYSIGMNKSISRWGSIITASAVFGAAHTGAGFTATPAIAFLAGLYLGIIYHPADGEFDLIEPIAIHSWWDTILEHRRLKGATFVEREKGDNALNYFIWSNKFYPLIGFNFRF